ncbi:MAG: prolyl oligopeptidase family serine peptidase [Verrucomicrobia bacterium]|nr:prolyl oligopeptidase family serine peptidase [Verrucomicrobiota bacterium]
MIMQLRLLLVIVPALLAGLLTAAELPGKKSLWNGFDRHDFVVDGRTGFVVAPKTAAPGKPWSWRTEFFGHEPQGDIALLGKGFHVAYYKVSDMYGAPQAIEWMRKFQDHVERQFGLAPRAVLEGFSRGGLYAFNYAATHPDKVAALYLDAPVLDIRSWPGGKGKGAGSKNCWEQCLKIFNLTEETAKSFKGSPLDRIEPVAKAKIPILSVCGETDKVVPFDENTAILAKRYRELGGEIEVICKPNCDHHPHSLKDPARIVNFILRHTPGMEGALLPEPATPYGYDYFALRGGLANCRVKFERQKTGRVAFMGGSITEGRGWRELVGEELQRRFPGTKFDFINAGISSTGSTPGAFRLLRDVFSHGPVDLLFEEAAVNDETNGFGDREQVRGMEGIIRHARLINPALDIIQLHFVDPDKMKVINAGKTPAVIANHEKVAKHYNVPSIDLAREVTERIHAREFTWEKDFKGLHPSPFGHTLYAKSIARLFDAAWQQPLAADAKIQPYPLPAKPLDEKSYFRGRLADIKEAHVASGWKLDPSWKPAGKIGTRKGFVNVPMLVAEEPGAALTLKFTGTAVGIFVAAGPDAGVVEFKVDGGAWKTTDLFTHWSGSLHIPWAYVLDADLTDGAHELTLRISDKKNAESKGHAARIVNFLAN